MVNHEVKIDDLFWSIDKQENNIIKVKVTGIGEKEKLFRCLEIDEDTDKELTFEIVHMLNKEELYENKCEAVEDYVKITEHEILKFKMEIDTPGKFINKLIENTVYNRCEKPCLNRYLIGIILREKAEEYFGITNEDMGIRRQGPVSYFSQYGMKPKSLAKILYGKEK